MEWTKESVIEIIELYKRKEIIWDPKHTMRFNKIRKQDTWEELGKEMNRPVDECVSTKTFLNRNGFSERCFLFQDFFSNQIV